MEVRDYIGNILKEGDEVVFILEGSFQKGTILNLYRNITHVVGNNGLTYFEKELITPETDEKDTFRNMVYAYVGWDGRYEEDHYGKEIEGTFKYHYAKDVPVFEIIKINNQQYGIFS